MNLRSSAKRKSLRQAAVAWFMKMHDAEPDHPERGRFEAWLMKDAANAAVYTEVVDVWEGFNSTAQMKSLVSALEQKEFLEQQRRTKVGKTLSRIAGVMLVVTVSLFGYQAWQSQPVMQLELATASGEIATQELQDGSTLTLNAGSEADITYYRNKRLVELKRGEAIFVVTPDEDRPFVVDSGRARVTVLGTRFAVNRLEALVRVSVDHGRVLVEQQHESGSEGGASVILTDGQVAEVNTSGKLERVHRPAADAFSFTQGVINFDQASLDEIAETLSRYRQQRLDNQARNAGDARITAVIKSNDIEKFIASLPHLAPVSVRQSAGATVIADQ